MTSEVRRGARVWAAGAALGCLLAVPHSVGIAAADSTDRTAAGADAGPQQSQAPQSQASATARSPRQTAHSARRAAEPGNDEPDSSARLRPTAAAVGAPRLPATTSVPATEAEAAETQAAGQLRRRTTATAVHAAPAAALPLPPQSADSATAPVPALAVAAPAPAAAATHGSITALRDTIANLVDSSLNWLNKLPVSPIAEMMSGALLLVRRNLEQTVSAPRADLESNQPIDQTFLVSTLADSGAGSLRQAIIDANAAPGADQITFSVAGTIEVGKTALPTITDTTIFDGTTAPGYATKPVVRIDFQNTAGLTLAAGATGSQISGLSLVDASGAGVTIAASGTTLTGNYIGLWGNGSTVEGNRGDGILVQASASGTTIGTAPNTAYTLSNVISGNGGNGITILGAGNVVQANYIGTNDGGDAERANRGNGIQITGASATGNLIGGTATNSNSPTEGIFARPPQGNVISGNRGNGVLIDGGAEENQLSGNFIGTAYSGNSALGNRGDGVAIVGADSNKLIGTTSLDKPFIYYNVLSGNRGNGLRITDSNDTIVHADFFGLGADNATPVANGGDGLLVNGSSQGVDIGGQIPLGNVMSGNRRWGIEIAGTSGGITSFNSFVGQVAFGGAAPNGAGGILVTSSNPGFDPDRELTYIRIRTSLIGGNRGNGIEFAGNAHGAEVTDTAVGTNYKIEEALPNLGAGIVVGGISSNIAIGGFQPSIQQADGQFSVHVGGNTGWGIVFKDRARDCAVYDTRVGIGIGLAVPLAYPLPNGEGGILVGRGTSNIVIGGPLAAPGENHYSNEIVGNDGDGVIASHTRGFQLLGTTISQNNGDGVVLKGVRDAVVGAPGAGNTITDNRGTGLLASGCLDGTTVVSSTISSNDGSGVRLNWARGITVGGGPGSEINDIEDNGGWGILATGWSRGSALKGNNVTGNTRGQINTTFSTLPSPTVSIRQLSQPPQSAPTDSYLVTGVRGAAGNNVVLTFSVVPEGQTEPQAGLFVGPLSGTATPPALIPPFDGLVSSTFYGPNTHRFNPRLIPEGSVQAVGNYQGNRDGVYYKHQQGMIYLGPPDGSGTWTTINVPYQGLDTVGGVSACEGRSAECRVASTIPHSTMGGLVVGNYDLALDGENQDPTTVNAFIYNTATKKYTLLGSPGDPFGALNNFTTIYGVWQNGGQDSSLYTLAGGSGQPGADAGQKGLIVTYDASTGKFGSPSYYVAQDAGVNTHFEGITPVLGGFALAGESLNSRGTTKWAAFVPTFVPPFSFLRNVNTIRYGSATWASVDINGSSLCTPSGCPLTTANTIYQNNMMGVFFDEGKGSIQTYVATLKGRFGLLPWWYL